MSFIARLALSMESAKITKGGYGMYIIATIETFVSAEEYAGMPEITLSYIHLHWDDGTFL